MEVVLAKQRDLEDIKAMYSKIIDNMYLNNIKIWNQYYPNELFADDIKKNNLYLIKEDNHILGAFAIYEHQNIETSLDWEDKSAKSFVLNRLGVNVDSLRKGIGQEIISAACKIAQENDAKYLRLLVCDNNIPAINLYKKCQFKKVNGIFEEKINNDFSLFEYGFEKCISENK